MATTTWSPATASPAIATSEPPTSTCQRGAPLLASSAATAPSRVARYSVPSATARSIAGAPRVTVVQAADAVGQPKRVDRPAAVLDEHQRPIGRGRPDPGPDRRGPALVARPEVEGVQRPVAARDDHQLVGDHGRGIDRPDGLERPPDPRHAGWAGDRSAGPGRGAAPAGPRVRRRDGRPQQRAHDERRANEDQGRGDEEQPAARDPDDDPRRQRHRSRRDERQDRGQRPHPLRLPEDLGEQPLGRLADVLDHRLDQGALERAVGRRAHAGRSRIADATRSGSSPRLTRRLSRPRWRRDFAVPIGTSSTAAAWVRGRSR